MLAETASARSPEALPLEQLTLALAEVFDLSHGDSVSDYAELEPLESLPPPAESPEDTP